jgi:glycosyltransferase involved in cell wall biosynthesis
MIVAHVGEKLIWGIGNVISALCKYHVDFKPIVVTHKSYFFNRKIRNLGVPLFLESKDDKMLRHLRKADIINLHCFNDDMHLYEAVKVLNKPIVITLHFSVALPQINSLIICVADWFKDMQHPLNKCITIKNRIDLLQFRAIKKHLPQKKVIIARICRSQKCDEFFWPVMIDVLNERPNTELWIVGQDGVSSRRIRTFGFQSNIRAILSKVDIVIHTPAPKVGAMDLVVMEVMALGVPSIFSSVDCVKASIGTSYNESLVASGDTAALKKKLLRLIDDPNLRYRMSQKAIRIAKTKFDIRHTVRQYENVYKLIMRDYHGRSRKRTLRKLIAFDMDGTI